MVTKSRPIAVATLALILGSTPTAPHDIPKPLVAQSSKPATKPVTIESAAKGSGLTQNQLKQFFGLGNVAPGDAKTHVDADWRGAGVYKITSINFTTPYLYENDKQKYDDVYFFVTETQRVDKNGDPQPVTQAVQDAVNARRKNSLKNKALGQLARTVPGYRGPVIPLIHVAVPKPQVPAPDIKSAPVPSAAAPIAAPTTTSISDPTEGLNLDTSKYFGKGNKPKPDETPYSDLQGWQGPGMYNIKTRFVEVTTPHLLTITEFANWEYASGAPMTDNLRKQVSPEVKAAVDKRR